MRHSILLSLLAALFMGHASAEKVRVITRDVEPFSFEKDGRRTGFAMDLWDTVAREMKLDYDVSTAGTAKEIIEAVQNKTAEVGVGALSITAEREAVIDFSQPFYESGLQILVSQKAGGITDTIRALLSNFLCWQVGVGIAIALVIMFGISHLVWMFEHPVNEEMWPRSYLAGMVESFWWTVSIFLVGGADNKGPVGTGGRVVATIWMIVSVIAVSLLTALLSAVFTVNSLTGDIKGPSDLPGKSVATIEGSTSQAFLDKLGAGGGQKVSVKAFKTIPECLSALKSGEVKAVVYDAPILKYYMSKAGPDDFALVGDLFEKNNYGFALQQDSPMREQINQILLTLNENGTTDDLRKKWFGDDK